MTDSSNNKRMDSASKIINASQQTIYNAFINPEALVSWLPPKGMEGHIHEFDARNGGVYRMSLTYLDPNHITKGKTSERADVVEGRFLEFIPNKQIVQLVKFETDDSAYAGEMIMTWTLTAEAIGTKVSIVCENVPEGIRKEDHDAGLKSTLENLALYTE
ncbi:SRPBCC family protein [Salibacterium aidingense]|uniref:SRPBCC family protein n=1 Tax=Salibacterium aidingense TaxID=384933 RepID=UPI00047EDA17|nr:SRPBCC family protein [Salibacterium aidingense]